MNTSLLRSTSLLRTTPLLRSNPSPKRSFHASPRPQFIPELITATDSILHLIHNGTGLPWVATIPLTALAVRLTITLPIAIYTRHVIQQKIKLSPIRSAWEHKAYIAAVKENPQASAGSVARKAAWNASTSVVSLYRRWGCEGWKVFVLPMSQLPAFLIIMETLRRMAGAPSGFIGLMFPNSVKSTEKEDALEKTLEAGTTDGSDLVTTDVVTTITSVPVEPEFATEGALWFENLLLPDPLPLPLLPCILSTVMIANVMAPESDGVESDSIVRRRWKRALILCSMVMAPLTMNMPAAILVYWISSYTLGIIQHFLLGICMPFEKEIKPCKLRIVGKPGEEGDLMS